MKTVSLEQIIVILLTLFIISIYYQNLQGINIPKISLSIYNQLIEAQAKSKLDSSNNTNNNNGLNFTQTFLQFPWNAFEKAAFDNNQTEVNKYAEKLIDELKPFIIREPVVPINSSCRAPNLDTEEVLKNCTRRKTQVKIGILLQFGFDEDSLEIYMNEVNHFIDTFFIVESTRTHFNLLSKPLIWELVKKQNRFEKFLDKVIHVVVDDVDIAAYANSSNNRLTTNEEKDVWQMENIVEAATWEKFLKWNYATEYFGGDDLLGFGHADEIPSRRTVNYLKQCEIEGESVDTGILLPFGQSFVSDLPVNEFPFTLSDPTFWRLSTAKMKSLMGYGVPSRNIKKSRKPLARGIHMNHYYGYFPLRIVHKISASEGGLTDLSQVKEISEKLKIGKVKELEMEIAKVLSNVGPKVSYVERSRLEKVGIDIRKIEILPWFYVCNRNRYPSWEVEHDLKVL